MDQNHTKEISRFSNTGKTFFFNLGKTRKDDPYLAINTIYGQGSKERVVVFPSQLLNFHAHVEKAIQAITGFVPAGQAGQADTPAPLVLPPECPKCQMGPAGWEITVFGPTDWLIECGSCLTHILDTR